MDRLLVMRAGALGDFLLGLPALYALREAFPRADLQLIAPAAVQSLATPLVDGFLPYEQAEVASLFVDAAQLPEELASRYRDLDLVLLWLSDGDGAVRRNFQRLGAQRLLWAPPFPLGPRQHLSDYLLDTLRPLGITPHEQAVTVDNVGATGGGATGQSPLHAHLCTPLISPSISAGRVADELFRQLGLETADPVVAIHPGSGGKWKIWPPERFARVADCLAALGARVVVIQGPADEEPVRRVVAAADRQPGVASGLELEVLAAFLARCSCYLGNDSGVTHLAASLATPTVAIFGPTDPAVWAPRGPLVKVLRSEGACAPCSRETAVECLNRTCLKAIEVDQVVTHVREALLGEWESLGSCGWRVGGAR